MDGNTFFKLGGAGDMDVQKITIKGKPVHRLDALCLCALSWLKHKLNKNWSRDYFKH